MSSSKPDAAEYFLRALEEYGVKRIFGNPGTTELPLMKSIEASDIEYELALHEDVAVGMAGGYASVVRYDSGNDELPLGVVNLHAIGGLAHGLGNLYGTYRSNVPLLVTAGAQSTDFRHKDPILTGDMVNLAEEFTKWSDEVLDPEALPHLLREAIRTALSPPMGPVFLSMPLDVMDEPLDRPPLPLGEIPELNSSPPDKIDQLSRLLQEADSPVFVLGDTLGQQGKSSVEAMKELAESTGAMVFGEILAAECSFPTDHEQWMSFLPPEADLVSQLLSTDLVVLVGCASNTPLFKDGEALIPEETECVHVHNDFGQIGKNETADLALHGNIQKNLEELSSRLEGQIPPDQRQDRLELAQEIKTVIDQQFKSFVSNNPIDDRCSKPEVVSVLEEEVPDSFLVDEGVTGRYALLNEWPMQAERYLSNKGGSLGYGLPASVGTALALSQRGGDTADRVLSYVGDGSFWYYPQSLYPAYKRNLPVTFLILNNRGYSILKDKLEEFYDHTEFTPGVDLDESLSSVEAARSQGLRGQTVNTTEGLREALRSETEQSGPGLIEVLVHD